MDGLRSDFEGIHKRQAGSGLKCMGHPGHTSTIKCMAIHKLEKAKKWFCRKFSFISNGNVLWVPYAVEQAHINHLSHFSVTLKAKFM